MHLMEHSAYQFPKLQDDLRWTLKINEPILNRPYQTNFPTEGGGEYITSFQFLLTHIAGGFYDHGNEISREDFPNSYTMISLDTSTDFCPKAYFHPINRGRLKLELQNLII